MNNIQSRITQEIWEAGKRASDIINEYLVHRGWDELKECWLAISLADGSTDGTLYFSRKDAVRHQPHEQQCYYLSFRNIPGGAIPKEMAIVLQFQREAYDAGFRLIDPDDANGGKEVLMTAGQHDYWNSKFRQQMDLSILINAAREQGLIR